MGPSLAVQTSLLRDFGGTARGTLRLTWLCSNTVTEETAQDVCFRAIRSLQLAHYASFMHDIDAVRECENLGELRRDNDDYGTLGYEFGNKAVHFNLCADINP